MSASLASLQMNGNMRIIINLQQGYNVTGTILNRPRAGRSKVTTVGQDRQITLSHTLQDIEKDGEYGISSQTVLRR